MDYLVIEGVKPWDGRYEFDLADGFTTREWGLVKRFSGYMPMTIQDGFAGGDPDLYASFALVALRRAGRAEPGDLDAVYDRIADAPFGAVIRLDGDPEEADAGPPPSGGNGNDSFSGAVSKTSSDPSAAPPSGSGMPASAISGWPPARSET